MKNSNASLEALKREYLARRLEKSAALKAPVTASTPIPAADRSKPLALSWGQQRLWFLDQLDHAASVAYHIPAGLRLRGRLDKTALQATLDRIVARHEALRTRFVQVDGAPVQRIDPSDIGFALRERDLSALSGHEQEAAVARYSAEETSAPFDLAQGPLVRGQLLRLSAQEHILLVTQHHIVSDGWSIGVLVNEVRSLYTAFSQGQADPLPPLAIQYADYAVWQRGWLQGETLQAQLDFWRGHLAGAPALLELPTDRPRPAVQSHAGGSVPLAFPAELTAGLRALAQRHGATLFMTLLAGWSVLLARLSGQSDLVIGTPVANRQRAAVEPLIGFFVNTLALRVRLDDDPSAAELLAQVKASMLETYSRQDLPFEQVVEAVNPVRSMGHSPLFQVMLALNNTSQGESLELPGLTLSSVATPHTTTHFDLSLSLNDAGGTLTGALEYASDLFDRATAMRWAEYLQRLLAAMAADDQQAVSRLALLPDAERQLVQAGFNDTAVDYPDSGLIHQVFEAQAARQPDAIALVCDDERVTYGELNRRANRIAHHLLSLGVRADDRVAICMERGLEMVAGMLGILKAGAAYVPLDPGYPAERVAFMLADSAPTAVLSTSRCLEALGTQPPSLLLDADAALLAAQPDSNPDPALLGLNARHLAYVIYTSGSTGQPKGVMVEHRSVLRLVLNQSFVRIGADDRLVHCANPAFDAATWEIWGGLLNGARLLVISQATLLDPDTFARQMREEQVTILHLTTGLFKQYADSFRDIYPTLAYLLFGGDQGDLGMVRRVLANGAPRHLVHCYGPTETTTFATTFAADAIDAQATALSIGRPIANTCVYLLDAQLRPVPLGVAGEIYIGGPGVARGYLNRADLTAERFLADPFSQQPGARLYRTGDLGRWRADGNIEFLGRNDFQVKIRGFRVELGEIEARLAACAGVREAVVVAREDGGDKRLVAYLLAQDGAALEAAELRRELGQHLAEYMVPSAFVTLDAFPLTPNGKLDRKALPAPGLDAVVARAYEAPQGEREEAIAAIWQQLLGLERVGRHDGFFELGGHSLMVIRMLEQMRQQGMTSDVRSVFAAPTVAGLAASMGDGQPRAAAVPPNRIPAGCTGITPDMLPLVDLNADEIALIESRVPDGAANIQDIYPLAPVQSGILFHHMLQTEGDPYLLRTVLGFDSRARLDGFLGALQQVIDRHDILRSAVLWSGLRQPVQVVFRHAPLPVEELAEAGPGRALERLLAHSDPRRMRLDLERAPLLKACVAVDPDTGEHFMALLNHHLVCDHVTLELIVAEIALLLEGRGEALPQALPYRNFIAQTLTIDQAAQEAYFRDQLGDVDEPTVPFGILDVHGSGEQVREARILLDDGLARRVRELSRQHGVTPAVLFHLAWAQVVSLASGRDDVVFGTVLSGRLQGSEAADRVVGMFINTLPIRVRLADVSVREALAASYRSLGELLVHEQASLALAQRCSGVAAPLPLFTSLFNYRHSHAPGAGDGKVLEWQGVRVIERGERTNYALGASVDDLGQGFDLNAQCVGVDPQRILDLLARATEVLAHALEHQPEQRMTALDILPAAERHQVMEAFNATARAYPQDQPVHYLFEQHAASRPSATALLFGDQQISYHELNCRANQLAHHLRGLGVGPDARVAVCLERGVEMVVGMLAILKVGGAYVPLDPDYPAERLDYMLDDNAPALVLAQTASAARFAPGAVRVLVLDAPDTRAAIAAQAVTGIEAQAAPIGGDSIAYIIYTSGSTGQPKGVMNCHRGLANLALAQREWFGVDRASRVLQFASISFDSSVFEMVMALCNGACLCFAPRDRLLGGDSMVATLQELRISHMAVPPSVLATFPDSAQLDGMTVILAGEVFPPALRERWAGRCRLINGYGPTETTVCATIYYCSASDTGLTVPIGRPFANTRIYLLDRHQRPVPQGVAGELYISAASVARGYLNRPELTAERFLADPFSEQAGARMYRTGDLGRWLADGNLEYAGRNDTQVKIRGFRIELGEIEARLAACAGVREAVVVARDEGADKRLVAYLIAQDGAALDAAALRRQLGQQMAEYMVPSAFVMLEAFPVTPNGKVDRKALPAPGLDAVVARAYAAPEGEREQAVAVIWQELLGLERVGRDDDFFELGGHSLKAIQLVSRIRQQFGVEVPLRALFAQPTVAALAALVPGSGAGKLDAITQADRGQPLPLSWAQQRLWFLDQLDHAASVAYHIPAGLRLRGRLDKAALQATLDRIVARHEALRTRFVQVDGAPVQRIDPADIGFALRERDLSALSGHEQEAAVARHSVDETSAPFDLAQGPLVRGQLLSLSEQEHVLLVTQHHIVSDGWSVGVLVNELRTLYTAFTQGQPDPLPPLAIQYADYALWQRQWLQGQTLQAQLDFWRGHLAGAPALLELPTDRPRPAVKSHAGGSVPLAFPAELTAGLRALAQRHGATLFMTLLAGWSALLARLSGQSDIVIGTPVANRQRAEVEPLIGFFINTLALRLRLDDDPSVAALLAQVKASTISAYDRQDVPFEQVVEAVNPIRSMGHSPLFQVMLALNNTSQGDILELPGLMLSSVAGAQAATHVDLSLSLNDAGGTLTGALEYASDLFDRATAMRWAEYLQRLLAAMAADDQQAVSRLALLPDAERQLVQAGFNDTAVDYPDSGLIHQVFEAQAARQPDAIALVCDDERVTYGELNRRANRIAHHLLSLGVRADDRVAICMERGLEMVAGMLGILKAGAAYVPLDPGYPAERVAFMLADSAPTAVLSTSRCREALGTQPPSLLLDADAALLAAQPDSNPDPALLGLNARHLAYVIYTSGSTGQPKGVMVEHRSVLRLVLNQSFVRIGADDRLVHCANPAFDAATWEIWGGLLNGARLLVISQATLLDPDTFARQMREEQVTILHLTTGLFKQYADSFRDIYPTLAYLLFGGDQGDLGVVRRVLANGAPRHLVHCYGPTETTTFATTFAADAIDAQATALSIGRPIANTCVYLLDAQLRPVPLGVAGEIYIGGPGVARGYLNRADLTAERFLADPFSQQPGARLYRTGDLGRWRADGNIEFLGRNDFQVKIRGFRVELGEIEARLAACAGVREAVVVAREDGGDKRLVAYLLAQDGAALEAAELRRELGQHLAEYMVPSAFVTLDAFPLTPNGKLDRKALPAPGLDAVVARAYEAPQGEREEAIAAIWQQLLGLERVGRHDGFFELGGHSLMVIRMLEQMRQQGMTSDVRSVFAAPTVAGLAASMGDGQPRAAAVPPNRIPAGCTGITPDMLPLVDLNADEIALIESRVPDGAANIQDIYPLAPVQSGILFHHLLQPEGDSYLLRSVLGFDSRTRLDEFLAALQQVIDRHDILRSAVLWTGLSQPVQVVQRRAPLPVEELAAPGQGDVLERLLEHTDPRRTRLDLERAPLLAACVAVDPDTGEHFMALLNHHLVCDHVSLELIIGEITLLLEGRGDALPTVLPYRNFIAQTLAIDPAAQEAYFRAQLGDVDEPTAPFGVLDVQGGESVREAIRGLGGALAARVRAVAREHGVTPAVLFHVAWARVVAECSGRDDVVFGTVMSGRLQGSEGADRVLGMFINTLPIRLRLKDLSVREAVADAYLRLSELMVHEQASLTLAQRCSGVEPPMPLFTSLFNYRHGRLDPQPASGAAVAVWQGVRMLRSEERTNYPIDVSVDDFGRDFGITVQCMGGVDPQRLADALELAIANLAVALGAASHAPVAALPILSAAERATILERFNPQPAAPCPHALLHQLFEAQAQARPEATALVSAGASMSYGEVNRRANQLAHHLIALGVRPDARVAICVERSMEMVVGLLGILKAGGAYVPLDPGYPAERLEHMLNDSAPVALLTQSKLGGALPPHARPVVLLDADAERIAQRSLDNPDPAALGLGGRHLAYVMYTSGSTGLPKGVMLEHAGVVNYVLGAMELFRSNSGDTVLQQNTLNFDISVEEIFPALASGAALMPSRELFGMSAGSGDVRPNVVHLTSAHWHNMVGHWMQAPAQAQAQLAQVRLINVTGDALSAQKIRDWETIRPAHTLLVNTYGPTEASVSCTAAYVSGDSGLSSLSIGTPMRNTRMYVLNAAMEPAPLGVAGEIYIGGEGVARGYLNRDDLTRERFLPDPFAGTAGARMYKTGDQGRWTERGDIEFLGRNDFQVKVRGFRVEPGEVEAALAQCAGVREAIVIARVDAQGVKRLIAYVIGADGAQPSASQLRADLAARVAEYMVPSAFVLLDAYPLTPNGKLDRKALPDPDAAAVAVREYEAPRGELETAMAQLWQDLLGLPQVSRTDHFFELGGHSLMAIQLAGRVEKQLGVALGLRTIFDSPRLEEMAAAVGSLQLALLSDAELSALAEDLGQLSETELQALLDQESME